MQERLKPQPAPCALARSALPPTSCTLNMGRYTNDPATLDFKAMRITTRGTSDHLKCCMRTVFQYPDSLLRPLRNAKLTTSTPPTVLTTGHHREFAVLAVLAKQNLDHPLWYPRSPMHGFLKTKRIGKGNTKVQSFALFPEHFFHFFHFSIL